MQVQRQQTECGSLRERVLVLYEMVDPDAVGISEDVKQTRGHDFWHAWLLLT